MQFLGLFYARDPRAMLTCREAPYYIIGRHALSAADCASDGGAVACASGRLRNGDALRAALVSGGVKPVDGSLSQLVLAAYRLWGEDYPARLGGSVCTAVIDQDAGRLTLSRDRMGATPVFYAYRGGSMAFSDHPGKILESPIASRAVDRDGVCELLGIGPSRTPGRTPFRDVWSLPPGCALVADSRGHKIRRYFALEPAAHEDDLSRTVETVRFLVEQAVADALPQNPAVMLSGGLSSSVLTALLARRLGRPVDSFSFDYKDNARFLESTEGRDEPFALEASAWLNTNHRSVLLTPDALFLALEEAMALRGFPGMADLDAALLLFARRIAQNHPSILSGDGGDEVFGGGSWFNGRAMNDADGFPWSIALSFRERVLKPKLREHLKFSDYVLTRCHEAVAALPRLAAEPAEEARLRRLQGLSFQWLLPTLLERASRMSPVPMITPYADDRLAQYLYNVPWAMKNFGGAERGLLREAARDLLPEPLRMRLKNPFPKTCHPRYTQLVREAIRQLVDDASSPILQIVSGDALLELASDTLPSAPTWFASSMSGPQWLAYLLSINQWMLRYQVELDL